MFQSVCCLGLGQSQTDFGLRQYFVDYYSEIVGLLESHFVLIYLGQDESHLEMKLGYLVPGVLLFVLLFLPIH